MALSKADHQTDRQAILAFQEIQNVGPAMSKDFERLGLQNPQCLIGRDPLELYRDICELDRTFHDPCVLDVYLASVEYMNGHPPRPWWEYTSVRKSRYSQDIEQLRDRFSS